jgi:hypothetical protein
MKEPTYEIGTQEWLDYIISLEPEDGAFTTNPDLQPCRTCGLARGWLCTKWNTRKRSTDSCMFWQPKKA